MTTISDKAVKATGHVTLTEFGRLSIKFSYDPVVIAKIKTLRERSWHSADKRWTAALIAENADKLRDWGFEFDKATSDWYRKQKTAPDISKITDDMVAGKLHEFQRHGVGWLLAHDGRGLLADDMRLGKTIQVLSYLHIEKHLRPVVAVVPASAKLNWEREAHRWSPSDKVFVVNGTEQHGKIDADIIVINYDVLAEKVPCPNHLPLSCKTCKGKGHIYISRQDLPVPAVVLIDECQMVKERSAQRTAAVLHLCKNVKHIIPMSGTPFLNRPVEGFTMFNLVAPHLFPSFWRYAQEFCGATHNGFGWDFKGASNTIRLHDILASTIMLRRRKEDVFADLPTEQASFVPMELDNAGRYRAASQDFIVWLRQQKLFEKAEKAERAETFARLAALKQLAAFGKLRAMIQWVGDFLDSGEKLVVFAWHQVVIDKIMEAFPDVAVKLDGRTSQLDKQRAVDAFQTDDRVRLFVGNILAAGQAIPLHAANDVAFFELAQTPGAMKQAKERVFNMDKAGTVDKIGVYYLIAPDSIDEDMARMLDGKSRVLTQVLDGEDANEESMLSALISKYTEAEK